MKKKYVKPISELIVVEESVILSGSVQNSARQLNAVQYPLDFYDENGYYGKKDSTNLWSE